MKGKLAKKPVHLQDWQKDFIGAFFGWLRIADGLRRYKELFLFVPRKNGKSLIVAGLALYLLLCDGEGGPEIYAGASAEKQARNLFSVARFMVKRNEDLQVQCEVLKDSIYVEHSEGLFQVIAGVADTMEGTNPSAFIADEVHTYKNNQLLEVMQSGMAGREQPAIIMLTTAGATKKDNPAYQQYQRAKQLQNGTVPPDPTFLGVLYEAPANSQIDDMEAIARANPNFGISVFPRFFEDEARKAKYIPALRNSFLRHHMNIWCDADDRWMDTGKWLACKRPIDIEKLKGRRCYGGLDLAQINDMNALVLVFPPENEGEKYEFLCWFWCPEQGIEERSEAHNVPYRTWAGDPRFNLTATPGEVADYDFIKQQILEIRDMFDLVELAFDPMNATMLTNQLAKEGVNCVLMRQGAVTMNEPIKGFMRLVLSGMVSHDNQILDWMSENAVLRIDHLNNFTFDKEKSSEKIDGIVAAAMAVGRALINIDDGGDPFEHGLRAA